MNDMLLLYIVIIICFVLIAFSFKYSKLFAIINAVLFCIYNMVLFYYLYFSLSGLEALVWWFYLILLNIIQITTIGVYLIIKYCKSRSKIKKTHR